MKRILRKHGYPPDKAEAATATVLEQAALFSDNWATFGYLIYPSQAGAEVRPVR